MSSSGEDESVVYQGIDPIHALLLLKPFGVALPDEARTAAWKQPVPPCLSGGAHVLWSSFRRRTPTFSHQHSWQRLPSEGRTKIHGLRGRILASKYSRASTCTLEHACMWAILEFGVVKRNESSFATVSRCGGAQHVGYQLADQDRALDDALESYGKDRYVYC